jgi:FAD:protein FMN transferase
MSAIIRDGDEEMKKLICVLLVLFTMSACSEKAVSKHTTTMTDVGFDTFVNFTGYTTNEAQFEEYASDLKKEFKRYDKLFDKYNDYEGTHNIKTINDQAGIKPVKVDKEIIELLNLSKKYYEISNHQFDITMGEVLNIWHDYRDEGVKANEEGKESRIPSKAELEKAEKDSGWDKIEINEKDSTVYIKDKNTSLDVGGVAKGFTVEKVAKKLEADGLKHGIINAGGNVRLIGEKPDGDAWSVGLQIPNANELSSDSLLSLKFSESNSFVTSGDYQRYYMYKNEIMHHIIDPDTLFPAKHARSVTVICKDSGIADILSTTLYTMTYEEGTALLKNLQAKEGFSVEAIWVYDDQVKPEKGADTIDVKGYHIAMSDGLKEHTNIK